MENEEKIKELSKKRNGYKAVVPYFYGKLKEITTIGTIQSTLTRLRQVYANFQVVQSDLEMLDEDQINERFQFEDGYGKIESVLLDKLEELNQNKISLDQNVILEKLNKIDINGRKDPKLIEVKSMQFKLPDMPLIKFDGNRLKWLSFRDVFVNVIHSNENITNIEKFYYLHGSVKEGSAYRLIETLPITNENYPIAWDKLLQHYDNEFAIQQYHIRCIYEIKKPIENSFTSLNIFVETIENNLQSLEALKIDHSNWSLFMNHHIIERLDSHSKIEILKKLPLDKLTSTKELLSIIKKRIRLLENLNSHKLSDKPQSQNSFSKQNSKTISRVLTTSSVACLYCQSRDHKLKNCTKFAGKEVSPSARFEFVKVHKLCTNCLSFNHRVMECTSGNCKVCNMKHHTLLHFTKSTHQNHQFDYSKAKQSQSNVLKIPSTVSTTDVSDAKPIQPSTQTNSQSSSSSLFVSNVLTTNHIQEDCESPNTILATVLLWVQSDKGYRIQCRALIDSGSHKSFITERMCQLLRGSKRSINHPVAGFSGHVTYVKYITELNIKSHCTEFSRNLQFLIVPRICGNLPNVNIDLKQINFDLKSISSQIVFADPLFHKSERVDMLLGVDIFNDILLSDVIVLNRNLPSFRESHLGYLVFGKLNLQMNTGSYISQANISDNILGSEENLSSLLQRFWQLDELPTNVQSVWSANEKMSEDHYSKNTVRLDSGRYSVALPVTPNIEFLGVSDQAALQKFYQLEKRLNNNIELKNEYRNFMVEYSNLGHMEEVSDIYSNDNQYDKICFLPHHAVVKNSSTTTKVRVVFNASSKTSSQLALNDVLLSGPTIQRDLFSIVIRFRVHLVGLSADITKMYRQIQLHSNQRDLHRIWWRNSEKEEIKCYRLKTVTYGTTCAPFLAIRTLFRLADDEVVNFSRASEILKKEFYVDDALTGTDTIEEAIDVKNELIQLLDKGGFELRKWCSNCSKLDDDPENTSNVISVLGLSWDTKSDSFCVKITESDSTVCTKRTILSEIAQLYDPIGFLSPVVVIAKQIMQRLWLISDINWDDQLPSDIIEYWNTFKSQLPLLEKLKIPRCVKASISPIFEIHAFGDASEKAYGSVLYVRTIGQDNKYCVRLLCSKSKVAPLKVQTIPRLELCAALLTAELVVKIKSALNDFITNIYYWSDSEITICRIKSPIDSNQIKLPVFEANRVSRIQEISSTNWCYVPSHLNPADIVSRGLLPSELIECSEWWNGPEFLSMTESHWPLQKGFNNSDIMKTTNSTMIVDNVIEEDVFPIILLSRYSNLFKLLRVVGYCYRFVNNCRSSQNNRIFNKSLKISEINHALKSVIKLSQSFAFSTELRQLSKGELVSTKSKLKSICPLLDTDSIIRVGGRLNNSGYDYEKKHPIVLSGSCSLSKLLVEYEHVKLKHAGPQQVLYNLRQRFWILHGRNLCKSVVHKCMQCFRVNPRSSEQFMGQLPSERVTISKPFHHVGIDFCGPFFIKYPFRSKIVTKSYICVFVCFVTRACHLEIVGDLTTQSFIASFRRFTSRRGRCAHVYSDNGTNFIGAKGELVDLQKMLNSEYHRNEVLKFCTENSIQWHNIPPRSPHFGGLWEAAVKVAKTHIKRVVGDTSFTLEQLS